MYIATVKQGYEKSVFNFKDAERSNLYGFVDMCLKSGTFGTSVVVEHVEDLGVGVRVNENH